MQVTTEDYGSGDTDVCTN